MNEFKIGLGLAQPGASVSAGNSSWLPRDGSGNRPILYLDLARNRGWYDGQAFATEALALAAVDGVASGGTRRVGDYVAPEAPELLANGDFAAGIGDWTVLNGATAAIVSGQLEMSGTGLTNATVRSASVATQQGKAYRAKATYRKGTASSSVYAFPSRSPAMSPPGNGMPANATTSPLAAARTFAGEGATHYLGLRTASGPNGTVYGDEFSIREALAFRGFSTPAFAAILTFRTPASLPASARVLFSFDDDGARNRYRAAVNPDGTITVVADANGVNQISHVIGADLVTLDAEHRLHVSSDGAARYLVALDGANLYGQNTAFTPAGACWVRLGASPAPGEEWTGEILSAALFAHEYAPPRFLWAVGDSYVGGNGGVALAAAVETTAPSRRVVSTGIGGTDVAAQLAAMLAAPGLHGCVLVHWDGDANGASLAADQAAFEQMASLASRHIFIGSGARTNSGADKIAATHQRNDWLSSRFGDRYLAPHPTLQELATGSAEDIAAVAAGLIPPSCLQVDGTHLTLAAMNAVAAAIVERLDALGL